MEALADCILTDLSKLGLDSNFLRDQGYDGASNMRDAYRGVQARVPLLYLIAMYTHCCSHVLTLVVSGASQLLSIRNAMVLWQAFVCLFRCLCSMQLFCESLSKRKHRHLVEKVNLYLCAKLAG